MTPTPAPAGAVQIAADIIGGPKYRLMARQVVTELARAGWLHDPAQVAELAAAAGGVRAWLDDEDDAEIDVDVLGDRLAAALRPFETEGSGR